MPINQYTALPTYCQVLSNTTQPKVPEGTIIEVVKVIPFGFTNYARFTYNNESLLIVATDLQELFLSDVDTVALETAQSLWLEVLSRMDRLPRYERETEYRHLLTCVEAAGRSVEVFIVFASSWLSTVRA